MADDVAAGSAELAVLYPAPRTVTIAGRSVQIAPPTLRRLATYDQLAVALWALGDGPSTPDEVLFEEHPEATADMLAAVVDVDREWLVALPPLRKLELFSAWLEFNTDFLSDRLQQQERLRTAMGAINGTGPTPSSTSQKTVSPAPKTTRPKGQYVSKLPSPAPKGASGAPA